MSTDLAAIAAPLQTATANTVNESLGVEERWAAWQAKVAERERVFRRKARFAVPVLILIAAVVLYAMLGR
jgi:hypothetical protein